MRSSGSTGPYVLVRRNRVRSRAVLRCRHESGQKDHACADDGGCQRLETPPIDRLTCLTDLGQLLC